jgi:hypothetical protein
MRPFQQLAMPAIALTVLSCSDAEMNAQRIDRVEQPIINGQVDTTHPAVVALFSQSLGCTGTIIHANGSNAYVLTAASCVTTEPMELVIVGTDYQNPDSVLNVFDSATHPQYDPTARSYNFALLSATGAPAVVPVIPVLRPEADLLAVGTPIEHVGYGLTSYPNGSGSLRHHTAGQVNQLTATEIAYDTSQSGPCSGDTGGPTLVDTRNGERVAGVISYGDQECNQIGVSGRVSAAHSFIVDYLGLGPGGSAGAAGSDGGGATGGSGGGAAGGSGGAAGSGATGATGGSGASSGSGTGGGTDGGGNQAGAGNGAGASSSAGSTDDSGCACRTTRSRLPFDASLIVLVAALGFLRRRRARS